MEVTVGGPDGTVSRMSDVGKVMKVQDIMSKGDASSVPSGLKAGMTIPDGKIKVQIGMVSANILTQSRKTAHRLQNRADRDMVCSWYRLCQAGSLRQERTSGPYPGAGIPPI